MSPFDREPGIETLDFLVGYVSKLPRSQTNKGSWLPLEVNQPVSRETGVEDA